MVIAAALSAGSCGRSKPAAMTTPDGSSIVGDGGGNDAGPTLDGAAADGVSPGSACVDQPGELPRPPSGRLPCELIPPGLAL